jgi:negative regulator of sigma E activity
VYRSALEKMSDGLDSFIVAHHLLDICYDDRTVVALIHRYHQLSSVIRSVSEDGMQYP